jgi:hypothetical protein
MATMAEITSDKRIDDLRVEMHGGFARTDQRIDDLRDEMREGFRKSDGDIRELRGDLRELRTEVTSGFAAVDAKFDSLNKTILYLLGGSLSVVTGGLIAAVFHVVS